MYRDWYGISSDDVLLHTGAFNWTYTLGTGLFDPWANGASSIVYTGPRDRSIWLRLIDELATHHHGFGTCLVPADAG
jgi:acyl-coenzyme A synthetase/AMP-(fatty) acid ligase